jgi:hypothetical protein
VKHSIPKLGDFGEHGYKLNNIGLFLEQFAKANQTKPSLKK